MLTTEVENDQTLKVGNDRTVTIKGNEKVTIEQGDQSTEVKLGDVSVKVDVGSITMEAMQSITLTVGSNSVNRAVIATAALWSNSARASGVVCDHAGKASCAARAASSACADDASGAIPTISSVAGFTTS